jgi:multisubunit Na+/H+ antiporter MnhC subunit
MNHLFGLYALLLIGLGIFNLATSWVDSRVTWLALAGGGAGLIAYVASRFATAAPPQPRLATRQKLRVLVLVRVLIEVAVFTAIVLYASVTVTSFGAFIAVVFGLVLAMAIIEFTIGGWEDRRDDAEQGRKVP